MSSLERNPNPEILRFCPGPTAMPLPWPNKPCLNEGTYMITATLLMCLRKGRKPCCPIICITACCPCPRREGTIWAHLCLVTSEISCPRYLKNSRALKLICPFTSPAEPPYFLSKRSMGILTWEKITDMPGKNQHPLLPPQELFECLQAPDKSQSWTCEELTICCKSGKGMRGKLLSAPVMDTIGIPWCHLVSSKLQPPSSTFWFHSRAATLAGKYNVLVTVDLFTKKTPFNPLRKQGWLRNLSYSMSLDAMAFQTAWPCSQPDTGRSSWGLSSKPGPCKLWGRTLLAGEFVGRVLRAPPGMSVPAGAPPTLPTALHPSSAQARAVHSWSED